MKRRPLVVAVLAALRLPLVAPAAQAPPLVRFGVVTDLHYADIDPIGARTYRESDDKLAECVQVMNAKDVTFLIELGDFKDQDKTPDETRTLGYLQKIESVFAGFKGPRYHVIGNHDTDSLSKTQFLAAAPNAGIAPNATRYTFVSGGVRFVVLDASHKADGTDYDHGNFEWSDSNVDAPQIEWLAKTLAASREPVIVFVHQQLDGTGAYYVKNAPQVREALETIGQGHRRPAGAPPRGRVQHHQRHPVLHVPWAHRRRRALEQRLLHRRRDARPERADPRLPPRRVARVQGRRGRGAGRQEMSRCTSGSTW